MQTAAPVLTLIIALPFVAYCWYDIINSESVRNLPKWLWIVLCSNLLGCIAYVLYGKEK